MIGTFVMVQCGKIGSYGSRRLCVDMIWVLAHRGRAITKVPVPAYYAGSHRGGGIEDRGGICEQHHIGSPIMIGVQDVAILELLMQFKWH